jgi:hypothetical protein
MQHSCKTPDHYKVFYRLRVEILPASRSPAPPDWAVGCEPLAYRGLGVEGLKYNHCPITILPSELLTTPVQIVASKSPRLASYPLITCSYYPLWSFF